MKNILYAGLLFLNGCAITTQERIETLGYKTEFGEDNQTEIQLIEDAAKTLSYLRNEPNWRNSHEQYRGIEEACDFADRDENKIITSIEAVGAARFSLVRAHKLPPENLHYTWEQTGELMNTINEE